MQLRTCWLGERLAADCLSELDASSSCMLHHRAAGQDDTNFTQFLRNITTQWHRYMDLFATIWHVFVCVFFLQESSILHFWWPPFWSCGHRRSCRPDLCRCWPMQHLVTVAIVTNTYVYFSSINVSKLSLLRHMVVSICTHEHVYYSL